ncbi:MAG: hypothetical protein COA92_04290 [Sulfurovum sp.]|nr:MAG: hypothetical protein COA92_04290 [Sulfurovum sp.]
MKNYSLSFDDERFDIDIIVKKKQALYELNEDNNTLFILVPFQDSQEDLLKILYPKQKYMLLLEERKMELLLQFFFLSVIATLLSLLAAFYTLKPLRNSLRLLEYFIKDIIHDLNTPLTSILINLKMIDGNDEEWESISRSAKNISMLHQNLDCYLREVHNNEERFLISELIEEQVGFFAPLYGYLTWNVDIKENLLFTDRMAFTRIVYNLLSNACKYNTSHGYITIQSVKDTLVITNDSYGISRPDKLFERFYKENERGLGIGLHIVEKLCKELGIAKTLSVEENIVTLTLFLSKVTTK